MIDLSSNPTIPERIYGGRNGNKIGIMINRDPYMIKFPAPARLNSNMSYANSTISEFVGCHIFNELGFDAQETILGKYQDRLVVACKDFERDGFIFKEFAFLKNSITDSSHEGYGTELSEVLQTIDEQRLVDRKELTNFFWKMFVVDAYIGNFDRHNGNWGFLINHATSEIKIAPIFDCGSCLFPQTDEKGMESYFEIQEERDKRIYKYPTSALKNDGVKINYLDYLSNTDNEDCLAALSEIHELINQKQPEIKGIIDDCEPLSDLHRRFLKEILDDRKKLIIDAAYQIQKSRSFSFNTPDYEMDSFDYDDDLEL